MAHWSDVETEAPETAVRARESFDAGRHKTMATTRADGSPRISGIECQFIGGDLWLGCMPGSRKAADLRRDSRLALHSLSPDPNPDDPTDWVGDAKLSGHAVEVTDEAERQRYVAGLYKRHPEMKPAPDAEDQPFDLFRVEVAEVVTTRVGDPADHLVIEHWTVGHGVNTIQRR